MCGIAGCLAINRADDAVRRMVAALGHRGPDDRGMARLRDEYGNVAGAFGHTRLAILDTSTAGHQPMESSEGRHLIVFNGEIYNFRELRESLQHDGVCFRSGSDTEVLLHGWALRGEAFVRELRGMFAFAIWDRSQRRVVLGRDPFGIKPLYVARVAEGLLFASEVRALMATGLVPRQIDAAGVHSYLATGGVSEPHSAITGVQPLEPGAIIGVKLSAGAPTVRPCTATASRMFIEANAPCCDMGTAAARVRNALRGSVRHHLVSDVPVALFLSGGIDSSLVVALAAEQTEARLDTFTVVFDEAEFSEAGPARAVAERYGTRHHEIPLSSTDLLESLPDAFRAMDQPSMDGINTYVVSRAVRDHGIKVVLSGLGGDELFAGYPSFRRARRLASVWAVGNHARSAGARLARTVGPRGEKLSLLLESTDPAYGSYSASRALFTGKLLSALGGDFVTSTGKPPGSLSTLQRVSWYELTGYMRNILLRDSDVFSMANQVELRVPFVDREVIAAAFAVDDTLKLTRGRSKPLLVAAAKDLVPDVVWNRPKQGFTLPFDAWMRGPLLAEIENTLSSHERVARVGIDASVARRVWGAFLARSGRISWTRPWALYTLVRWAEETGAAVQSRWSGTDRMSRAEAMLS